MIEVHIRKGEVIVWPLPLLLNLCLPFRKWTFKSALIPVIPGYYTTRYEIWVFRLFGWIIFEHSPFMFCLFSFYSTIEKHMLYWLAFYGKFEKFVRISSLILMTVTPRSAASFSIDAFNCFVQGNPAALIITWSTIFTSTTPFVYIWRLIEFWSHFSEICCQSSCLAHDSELITGWCTYLGPWIAFTV